MIALLRDLRPQVSGDRQIRIDDLLAGVLADVADAAAAVGDPIDKYRGPIGDEERGEADVSAGVGSSGGQDILDEDLMRDEETRAAGFIGKASEIQWLRSLHSVDSSNTDECFWGTPGDEEAVDGRLEVHRRRHSNQAMSPLMPSSKVNFYLNDETFESDLLVDPLEMPPFEIAEKLLQAFMQSVQNSFPLLAKKTFVDRFYHYYVSLQRGTPFKVPRTWQATLNLVFAIGAVYSHLTKADWQADDRDHLIYHSRAWLLSLKDPWGFSHPDLPHVQITGLLSFYYLCTGHINRSWILIGSAVRSGFALGLHLRNEDGTTSAPSKETNARIWWAHYSLERLVSTLNGRPSLGMGHLCSVPLPLPLASEEIVESIIESRFGDKGKRPLVSRGTTEQSNEYTASSPGPANSGSYLRSIVSLGEITQAALELYSANTVRESWDSIQRTIAHQSDELNAWAAALPQGLNFLNRSSFGGHRYIREQNILNILYHSTKILITRPCLCRIDRRTSNQMANLDTFNRRAALHCVEAAQSVAMLLPDATPDNLVRLYETGPWWQMTHIIMQALVVLCLEIAAYNSDDPQGLIPSLKILLRWLRIMSVNNGMAVRAYSISTGLLQKLTATLRIDMKDLLDEDEVMNDSTELAPATFTPAQAPTAYPNVLNPVDEGHGSQRSATARNRQHHNEQQRQQSFTQGATPRSQYHPRPSQRDDPSRRPSLTDRTSAKIIDAFNYLFPVSSGPGQTVLPGWIVTSFDERNLWAELGFENMSVGVQ
ncbi:fungal-specific transcription factor domain-containing protein [Boeremia exigua]|uniref:fungal-specific transcription factor domain-containing protein n=1 Tax=Boeremia exigua TaxID=749465 RepID=UPI001E8D7DDC|nr:fungal-specific transcription factor domain-containing protein [Boeremia exigua]KAH6620058.1 fungal-specific transcription factor domain-containing protein [Boeremia exigua]